VLKYIKIRSDTHKFENNYIRNYYRNNYVEIKHDNISKSLDIAAINLSF